MSKWFCIVCLLSIFVIFVIFLQYIYTTDIYLEHIDTFSVDDDNEEDYDPFADKQRLYSFGDWDSIHLMRNSCINASGIYYYDEDNKTVMNRDRLLIQTDLWSRHSNIIIHKINNINNSHLQFSNIIGYLLWTSNLENIYHFTFSLIGGFKALQIINESKKIRENIDINNIKLIYFGTYPPKTKLTIHSGLELLYNGTITNLDKHKPIQLKSINNNDMKCYKTLIIGRAAHWEIDQNDFNLLSNKLNSIYPITNINDKYGQYIKYGQNNNYLNILLLQRSYPRRHIINMKQIKTVLIHTFNNITKDKINSFKQNRLKYSEKRFFSNKLVMESLDTLYPNIMQLQFENITVIEQFKIIYHTDILISSHGAGLIWNLFMSPQSYLIELFPEFTTIQCNNCYNGNIYSSSWSTFAEIAQWGRSHHICIKNAFNNDMEKIIRSKYIQLHNNTAIEPYDLNDFITKYNNYSSKFDWKEIPYLLSNSSLYKMIHILWNIKFGTILSNDNRTWCRQICVRYLLKENICNGHNVSNLIQRSCDIKPYSDCKGTIFEPK